MCFSPDGTLIVHAGTKDMAEQRDQLYGNWRNGPEETTSVLLQIDPGSERANILQLLPFSLEPYELCADQQYVYFAGGVPPKLVEQRSRDKIGNVAIYRLKIAR